MLYGIKLFLGVKSTVLKLVKIKRFSAKNTQLFENVQDKMIFRCKIKSKALLKTESDKTLL
jgi:hypothetical protein